MASRDKSKVVASKSQDSTRTSIVSIDSAIANHIIGRRKDTVHAGHARTESSPARAMKGQLSTVSRGHNRTASAPHTKQKRSNSLKRAKNSTELLKQRSINAGKAGKVADTSTVKRGRNFTVSNVGTGGLLHLSPTPHQQPFSTTVAAPSPYPWIAPPPAVQTVPTTVMGTTQQSEVRTRSISPKRLLDNATRRKKSRELPRSHVRSQSFSTLDESRRSIAASLQPKTLKIVINRPQSIHDSEGEEPVPSLQIPIPHYKLGTPRFSAHGTPFIRASLQNRGSELTSTDRSSTTETIHVPPLSSMKAFAKIQHSIPSSDVSIPIPDPLRVVKNGEKWRTLSSGSYISPITASLYDKLLEVYDDPSTVRYSNDKDIVAATKIRIIAQISSESFMDYDLVSDFFLTFRSYMTTFEVLDYLLARLRWSVSRLSDDGRIIRIRTFAALRHWILNYFDDDFVVNRRLRVRFCEEVNALYETVRQRPRGMAGTSDLKILQDLKRCWNGRCSLYWDAEEFNMDANQEDPLLPGGVIGSRNPAFADISEATAALGLGLQGIPTVSSQPATSTRTVRKTHHKRLPSSEYAKKPISIQSEQSLHAGSCSLPRYLSKSPEGESEKIGRGPQLISVLSRRQNAPADLKVHINSPSASHDDLHPLSSARDDSRAQTPVEALATSGHYGDPHTGSMIRGFVYGPVEPFVQLPLHPPLSPSVRFSAEHNSNSSLRIPSSPSVPSHAPQNPAVKNIFGSIRRALSGKQGSNEVTLITVSTPKPLASDHGPRSTVPSNLRSNDDLRKRATGTSHVKTQLRIDLLCAAAVQSFQNAVPGAQESMQGVTDSPRVPLSQQLASLEEDQSHNLEVRMPSHYTARSGSILIVDDTAVAMPVMSGALPVSYLRKGSDDSEQHDLQFGHQVQNYQQTPAMLIDRNQIGIATSPGLGQDDKQSQSPTGSAFTVRKLQSSPLLIQSNHNVAEDSLRSTSPPSLTEATSSTESPVSRGPTHGLRRRPGGDLRGNDNVHDLETSMHHRSMDSIIDSSSVMSPKSMTTTSSPDRTRKESKVSMILTDSSQQFRPSFKAAFQRAVTDQLVLNDEEDGGPEATLLKLEGRFPDKSPSLDGSSRSPTNHSVAASSAQPLSASTEVTEHEVMSQGTKRSRTPLREMSFLVDDNQEAGDSRQQFAHESIVFGLPTESPPAVDSDGSDISLPILRSDPSIGKAMTTDRTVTHSQAIESDSDEARSSSDILETQDLPRNDLARPQTALTEGATSFLLDDDDDATSDLSSEISVDIITFTNDTGKPISPMLAAPGTAISGLEIPSHPLTHASLVNLPVTSPTLAGGQFPTPQTSPQMLQQVMYGKQTSMVAIAQNGGQSMIQGPAHIPFILACDSQVLAQQMTIVEQSALTEIEWTDLVEMRWNNDKSGNTLDWGEYMARHDDARGIDVVSARFNLVHKWVQSEIVLTQDMEERARVLSKFIHVAAHARRLHNYATMLQITIALSMSCISKLKKTWELVPAPDRSLLKNMEDLARPTRNFHDLRVEMESTDLSAGCIPFLGLYVHDLTYNANKPSEIKVEDGGGPLVNFERYRTAAIIIKGLLRLIDASLRYDFDPIHGIVERCLWLSSLTNGRIDSLSKQLE